MAHEWGHWKDWKTIHGKKLPVDPINGNVISEKQFNKLKEQQRNQIRELAWDTMPLRPKNLIPGYDVVDKAQKSFWNDYFTGDLKKARTRSEVDPTIYGQPYRSLNQLEAEKLMDRDALEVGIAQAEAETWNKREAERRKKELKTQLRAQESLKKSGEGEEDSKKLRNSDKIENSINSIKKTDERKGWGSFATGAFDRENQESVPFVAGKEALTSAENRALKQVRGSVLKNKARLKQMRNEQVPDLPPLIEPKELPKIQTMEVDYSDPNKGGKASSFKWDGDFSFLENLLA